MGKRRQRVRGDKYGKSTHCKTDPGEVVCSMSLSSLIFSLLLYFYPRCLPFKLLERRSAGGFSEHVRRCLGHITPTQQGKRAQTLAPSCLWDGAPPSSLGRDMKRKAYLTSLCLGQPLCEMQMVVVMPNSQLAVRTK